MKNIHRTLVIGCSLLALSACGPEDLGSPGTNGDINVGDINVGGGSSGGGGSGTVTPRGDCPVLEGSSQTLTDSGTIAAASGSYRVCTLPGTFTESTTLVYDPGVVYRMNGRVDVGTDDGPVDGSSDGVDGTKVTLTIKPGVILYGDKDVGSGSYMIVNRGSKLMANGSPTQPIIFTGQLDINGAAGDTDSAMWGGVVMLGRAPVSDCDTGGINQADQTKCQMKVEGIANGAPYFGGNTPGDNSGSMTYVQIRYSGFTLSNGSELQSLTLGGVGSNTVFDFIQSYNSSDDGVEFFGGHPHVKHYISVGAEDDSFDVDSGAQLDLQFALAVQRAGVGDKLLENDSPPDDKGSGTTIPDAMPRTLTRISNFTFYAPAGGAGKAIEARGAGDIILANGVIKKPNDTGQACINDHGEVGGGRGADVAFYSVELDCTTNAFTDTAVANGSGNKFQVSTLTGLYLNGASEQTYTPIYDVATQFGSIFLTQTYIGAVSNALDWTKGWTCDSTTVSFGTGRSCKSLPV